MQGKAKIIETVRAKYQDAAALQLRKFDVEDMDRFGVEIDAHYGFEKNGYVVMC